MYTYPLVSGGVGGELRLGEFFIVAISVGVLSRRCGRSLPSLLFREYVLPLGALLREPRAFFGTDVRRKTTDAAFGFLVASVVAATVLTIVLTWLLVRNPASSALGIDSEYFTIVLGQRIEPRLSTWRIYGLGRTVLVQFYLFAVLLALLATPAITVTTGAFDSSGDFRDTLATVCYGMAPAPLLAIPAVVVGFDLQLFGSALGAVLLAVLPAFLLITRTMDAGLRETHDLSSERSRVVAASVRVAWLAAAGVIWWGVAGAGAV